MIDYYQKKYPGDPCNLKYPSSNNKAVGINNFNNNYFLNKTIISIINIIYI